MRFLILLAILLGHLTAALAQGAGQAPAPVGDQQAAPTCGSPDGNDTASPLLGKTLHRPASGANTVPVIGSSAEILGVTPKGRHLESIVAQSDITIRLKRPPAISRAEDWNQAYTFGAAETVRRNGDTKEAARYEDIFTTIESRTAEEILVNIKTPQSDLNFYSEPWNIVIILCKREDDKILGYSVSNIYVMPSFLAISASIFALALFWGAITLATRQLNAKKLQDLWLEHISRSRIKDEDWKRKIWKFWQAANPIFIAQDSLGYGSLARLQILLFTTTVGVVLFYIFIHSGELTTVSNTILILLGIMVVGGTFARAAPDWNGMSAETRRVLFGEELIQKQLNKPRFSDLLESQGEIDVAKVQALMFTTIVAISIVVKGYSGLNAFALPDQFIYLLGISQGTYVLGKLIPTDVKQRIEQDFEQLRQSADRATREAANTQAMNAFYQARAAAQGTLKEVFLERFNDQKFKEMGPDRFATIPANPPTPPVPTPAPATDPNAPANG